jgi:hypothetical protein
MLLFVLWAVLAIAALVGAGYSHYRYRVINNRYYERLFSKEREASRGHDINTAAYHSYTIPGVTFVMLCILVMMSLAI